MISALRDRLQAGRLWIPGTVAGVLLLAALLGLRASPLWLVLPLAGMGAFALSQQPILGLMALVPVALIARMEIGTGTEVALNPATLLVPALLAIWILDMISHGQVHLVPSRTNRPLLFFLAAGLVSLAIGQATWNPAVPRSGDFWIVQMAQWAIFAFSAGAYWLTANLVQDGAWLRRLTFTFLALAGGLAILRVSPGTGALLARVATHAMESAVFWMLLAALALGQLLFNRQLTWGWRVFLGGGLVAVTVYAFYVRRETIANWVGVAAVAGILAWLRWPRLRWPVILLLAALAVSGALSSTVYEFAGGGDEWAESGGSRLALIGRVVEVTMRNPITGLGPAAYRPYANMEPLSYGGAYWVNPVINSHNNYVDLFAHVGLLGMALFFWFAAEMARLGLRLRALFREGFAAGYVNAMLAAGAAALVLMLLIDGILPFVYNFGFRGFQASVLVWLFLGGLVSLEAMKRNEVLGTDDHAA
jgi:hypothetical protein